MSKALNYVGRTFDNLLLKLHLTHYKDIILFLMILALLHFGLNGWNQLHNYPLTTLVDNTEDKLKVWSYTGGGYILDAIGCDFTTCNDTQFFEEQAQMGIQYQMPLDCYTYYFEDSTQSLAIINACSGFKQLLITLLLLMIFPGPWKKKLWFIPMAIVLMFITNLVRIAILGVLLIHYPDNWDFLHMSILRPAYYVVLAFIWVWWNEKYYRPSLKSKQVE